MRGRFSGANCAYRRQAVLDAGGYDYDFRAHGEDIDLFLGARSTGRPGCCTTRRSASNILTLRANYRTLARKSFGYGVASRRLDRARFPARKADLSLLWTPWSEAMRELLREDGGRYPQCVLVDRLMFALGRCGICLGSGRKEARMSIAEAPICRLVHSFYRVGMKTQVVRIALRLDVLLPLANGPAGVEAVADACACSAAGITLLLDNLCRLGLLTNTDGQYAVSPTWRRPFSCPVGAVTSGAGCWNKPTPTSFRMSSICRTGVPFRRAVPCSSSPGSRATMLPVSSTVASCGGCRGQTRTAPGAARPRPGLRLRDHNPLLAQLHPTVHVTCVDSPAVLAAAEDLSGRLGVQDRTRSFPATSTRASLNRTATTWYCWKTPRISTPCSRTKPSSGAPGEGSHPVACLSST